MNGKELPLITKIDESALFLDFVRKHHLSAEDLTERQLAEAIRQAMPDFRRNTHADKQSVIYLPRSEADRWKGLYHDLLMSVKSKHEGESRHETALRYIRERENPIETPEEPEINEVMEDRK